MSDRNDDEEEQQERDQRTPRLRVNLVVFSLRHLSAPPISLPSRGDCTTRDHTLRQAERVFWTIAGLIRLRLLTLQDKNAIMLSVLSGGLAVAESLINLDIESLTDGGYLATSDDLPGLVAQGRTIAECVEIAQDVARKLIESYDRGDPLPHKTDGDQPSKIGLSIPVGLPYWAA